MDADRGSPWPTEKECGACGQTKPLDAFRRQFRGRFNRCALCKVCHDARHPPDCDCDDCYGAYQAHNAGWRRYNASRALHGSRARFNAGCRCDVCVTAELERCVAQQANGDRDARLYRLSRGWLIAGTIVSLDEEVGLSGHDRHRFTAAGVQRHMVEWHDPTADAALARLS